MIRFNRGPYQAEASPEGEEGGGAPAAPAPAPAPAPAQKPEPAPEPEETPEPIEYEKTGDATLDYVLSYIGEQGLDHDNPAVKAALSGDFAQLEVELLKKGAVGADKIIDLAQRSFEKYQEEEQSNLAETGKALIEIAGGEDQWEEVVTWAKDNAEPEEKEEINALLQKGGISAKIAAQFLVSSYRNTQGTEFEGKSAAPAAATPAASAPSGPISRVEFAKEAERLYRKVGEGYQKTPQYRQLAQRRAR